MDETAHTGFRDRRIQPLCHLSERGPIVGALAALGGALGSSSGRRSFAAVVFEHRALAGLRCSRANCSAANGVCG